MRGALLQPRAHTLTHTLLCADVAAAEARLGAAQQSVARMEAELRDYKARAHALLKAKETELRAAKDIVREESAALLAEAEARATGAEARAAAAEVAAAEVAPPS